MIVSVSIPRGVATRNFVVDEGLTWLGTPYEKGARVKHGGIDCGTLLFEIYRAVGFISDKDQAELDRLMPIDNNWFCHTTEQKYIKLALRYAHQVLKAISYKTLDAQPGNIAVTHHAPNGEIWNHGGLIVKWPLVLHAVTPVVELVDVTQHWLWCYREVTIFDPWEKLAWEGVT